MPSQITQPPAGPLRTWQVPVLVARYGGTSELAARVQEAVRSQQNSDAAVAMGQAAAAILERVVVQVGGGRGAVQPLGGGASAGRSLGPCLWAVVAVRAGGYANVLLLWIGERMCMPRQWPGKESKG